MARSLRPSGGLTQSLTSNVPTRRLKDDPQRWSSGLFYDCELFFVNLIISSIDMHVDITVAQLSMLHFVLYVSTVWILF